MKKAIAKMRVIATKDMIDQACLRNYINQLKSAQLSARSHDSLFPLISPVQVAMSNAAEVINKQIEKLEKYLEEE